MYESQSKYQYVNSSQNPDKTAELKHPMTAALWAPLGCPSALDNVCSDFLFISSSYCSVSASTVLTVLYLLSSP